MKTEKEKILDILAQTEKLLTHYPRCADDPEQEQYYCATLILTKSEMKLVQDLLKSRLKDEELC